MFEGKSMQQKRKVYFQIALPHYESVKDWFCVQISL